MEPIEELSPLIGDIYDAALDPALWTRVIENTAGFVGGCAGGLVVRDSLRGTGGPSYD